MIEVKHRRTSNVVRHFLGKDDVFCLNFAPKWKLEVELSHAFSCHHGSRATRSHFRVEILDKNSVVFVLATNDIRPRINEHSDGFIWASEQDGVNKPLPWVAYQLARLHLYLQGVFSGVAHFLKMAVLTTVLAPQTVRAILSLVGITAFSTRVPLVRCKAFSGMDALLSVLLM